MPGLEETFTSIYESGRWATAGAPRSGRGSTLEYTRSIRKVLPNIVDHLAITSVFDAPCGDMNWMPLVAWRLPVTYIGVDVVRPLIRKLQAEYAGPRMQFEYLDITVGPFPNADLWLCRDCFCHLSFADIRLALEQLRKSSIKYALISSHVFPNVNVDVKTGGFRPLDLTKSPFYFPQPKAFITESQPMVGGHALSPRRSLLLWEVDALRAGDLL